MTVSLISMHLSGNCVTKPSEVDKYNEKPEEWVENIVNINYILLGLNYEVLVHVFFIYATLNCYCALFQMEILPTDSNTVHCKFPSGV